MRNTNNFKTRYSTLLKRTALLTLALPLLFGVCAAEEKEVKESSQAETASFQDPQKSIETTLDKLVEVVESHPGDEERDARRELMRKVIEPRFDFEEMAMRSLGANWLKIKDDERTRFVEVFSELLAKTYLNRLESLERGMVSVNSTKVQNPKALVRTTVKYEGDTFPLDYKLLQKDNRWRVYDVIIENIGLVSNYRNEFSGIIRKERFEGLMKRLEKKVQS